MRAHNAGNIDVNAFNAMKEELKQLKNQIKSSSGKFDRYYIQ